jgi:hypothetical protein
MKSKMYIPKKSKAQAMVEFAIALPILLMLLYGILEAGRLLFLYSTIVTASRQAVRYGSATGVGTGGVPRYQDCAGIRAVANKSDFLNAFDDSDIVITYDDGPGTAGTNPSTNPPTVPPWKDICDGTVDTGVTPSTANTTRINVIIRGDFFPIVPKLVPFIERSATSPGGPILGESARTILVSISIAVTAPPQTWEASTPTYTFTPSPTPSPTATRTPTPTLTPTPIFTNTPSITPTRTLTPTLTMSPTITHTPTLTVPPTSIPTGVTGCNSITNGTITRSGNSLILSLSSPVPVPVQIQNIFVVWNHDKGNEVGNKKVVLNAVSLAGQFWSGASDGPSQSIIPSPTAYIPTGNSTLTLTFDSSYDFLDGTEEILINLSTPGCTSFPIHANPN